MYDVLGHNFSDLKRRLIFVYIGGIFCMFPRPPENISKARKFATSGVALCATGWGPPVVNTYPAALQIDWRAYTEFLMPEY